MGFGAMGASLLAGAAVGVGVDAGVNQVRTADLLRPLRVVINLLLGASIIALFMGLM